MSKQCSFWFEIIRKLSPTQKSYFIYAFPYLSNTTIDVDIDDIVYRITISILKTTISYTKWRYQHLFRKTLISCKTNYVVDIEDIVQKMNISKLISTLISFNDVHIFELISIRYRRNWRYRSFKVRTALVVKPYHRYRYQL